MSFDLLDAIGWQGRRIDPNGLYYNGARSYSPTLRIFIAADPLGHSASLDLYSFCGGDSLNHLDTDGRARTITAVEVGRGAVIDDGTGPTNVPPDGYGGWQNIQDLAGSSGGGFQLQVLGSVANMAEYRESFIDQPSGGQIVPQSAYDGQTPFLSGTTALADISAIVNSIPDQEAGNMGLLDGNVGTNAVIFGQEFAAGLNPETEAERANATNFGRHAYWQAELTREDYRNLADGIGNLHEVTSQDPLDTIRDLHNNQVGQRIGLESRSEAETRQMILEAWNQGQAATIQNVGGVRSVDFPNSNRAIDPVQGGNPKP